MATLPRADLEARPGMVVALRLRLHNRMMAAALVRPMIDDWVASDATTDLPGLIDANLAAIVIQRPAVQRRARPRKKV